MRAQKPKEGRRFRQPSGVANHALVHPGDGRAMVAAGSVPLTGKGRRNLRSNGRYASAGRSPGRGRFRRAAFPPRCPCDSFAPCGAPASRSGGRSTRSPKGRFIRSPRIGSVARRLPAPLRLWLHCSGLARKLRRPAATRVTRSEDGFCVHGFQSGPLPESIGPCPSACHPPARSRGVPLDACPFRSRLVDANIAPAVSRGGVPVLIHVVSRRHLHVSGRDKHLISLWFPAAASSACPMMLSWFASRAKRRSTVTICG